MSGQDHRGERNPHSRLTCADAENIRRRRSLGEAGQALAAEYGVHKSLITMIVKGRRWAIHTSDCATHNEPALPNGPCDCGATTP